MAPTCRSRHTGVRQPPFIALAAMLAGQGARQRFADVNETNIIALNPPCSGLNEQMPNNLYLAIFANQPQQWGFRGDPYLWRLLATKLAGMPDAANGEAAIETIYRVFTEITGEHLDIAGDFRLDGIPEHGMSGGLISGETWRGRLIPLLRSRAESYFNEELS